MFVRVHIHTKFTDGKAVPTSHLFDSQSDARVYLERVKNAALGMGGTIKEDDVLTLALANNWDGITITNVPDRPLVQSIHIAIASGR